MLEGQIEPTVCFYMDSKLRMIFSLNGWEKNQKTMISWQVKTAWNSYPTVHSKVILKHTVHAFMLQWLSWVVGTETLKSTKPKIFTSLTLLQKMFPDPDVVHRWFADLGRAKFLCLKRWPAKPGYEWVPSAWFGCSWRNHSCLEC